MKKLIALGVAAAVALFVAPVFAADPPAVAKVEVVKPAAPVVKKKAVVKKHVAKKHTKKAAKKKAAPKQPAK